MIAFSRSVNTVSSPVRGVPRTAWGRVRRAGVAFLAAALPAVGLVAVSPSPASAAPGTLSYVASASTAGARSNHTVVVPASVQPGDALVLFLTTNTTTGTLTDAVPGWTLLQTRDGNAIRGRVWTKLATGRCRQRGERQHQRPSSSPGSAWRPTAAPVRPLVSASPSVASTASASSHATPTVPVAKADSWLVNYWAEKSSTTQTFTLPGR